MSAFFELFIIEYKEKNQYSKNSTITYALD